MCTDATGTRMQDQLTARAITSVSICPQQSARYWCTMLAQCRPDCTTVSAKSHRFQSGTKKIAAEQVMALNVLSLKRLRSSASTTRQCTFRMPNCSAVFCAASTIPADMSETAHQLVQSCCWGAGQHQKARKPESRCLPVTSAAGKVLARLNPGCPVADPRSRRL